MRVRLWDRLSQLVTQDAVPKELRRPNREGSQVKQQEHERSGPSGPAPSSPCPLQTPDGFVVRAPATFYLDFFGNVVSPAAVTGTLTFANVDHIFPYSRGGLSKGKGKQVSLEVSDSNLMLLQHVSNSFKEDHFQQSFVRWVRHVHQ